MVDWLIHNNTFVMDLLLYNRKECFWVLLWPRPHPFANFYRNPFCFCIVLVTNKKMEQHK